MSHFRCIANDFDRQESLFYFWKMKHILFKNSDLRFGNVYSKRWYFFFVPWVIVRSWWHIMHIILKTKSWSHHSGCFKLCWWCVYSIVSPQRIKIVFIGSFGMVWSITVTKAKQMNSDIRLTIFSKFLSDMIFNLPMLTAISMRLYSA